MALERCNHHARLINLVWKTIGWSATTAMFLASNPGFALNIPTSAESDRGYEKHNPIQPNSNITLAQNGDAQNNPNERPRFTCQFIDGEYTVMYHPESQPGQAYPWANPSEIGGGWTPERRCNEISRRLESYRPDGLVEMQTAVENNYNIICVTTEEVPDCRIVLTVPDGEDPELIRDQLRCGRWQSRF